MALRKIVKQRDFGAVHQLLTTAYALGLADNPAASQAAEMLERLATFATTARADSRPFAGNKAIQ